MKTKVILIVLLATMISDFSVAQIFKKFHLPGANIKAKDVCGNCEPGNYGLVLPLYKKTFEPDLLENSNDTLIAYQILGRTYSEDDLSGSHAWRCSEDLNNPFSMKAIVRLSNTTGTSFSYQRTERLDITANVTAQANLDALKALNPEISAAVWTAFGAKLNAGYTKFAQRDLTITGIYSEWGINKDSVEGLVRGARYSGCKKFLKDNNYRLIDAIGMIYFDISFGQDNLDKVATELQAEAELYGIKGNVAFTFKNEISKKLTKVTKGYYQILVWRTIGVDDLTIN